MRSHQVLCCAQNVLDKLAKLPIDTTALQTCKIGRTMRRLSKTGPPALRERAARLMAEWIRVVDEEGTGAGPSGDGGGAAAKRDRLSHCSLRPWPGSWHVIRRHVISLVQALGLYAELVAAWVARVQWAQTELGVFYLLSNDVTILHMECTALWCKGLVATRKVAQKAIWNCPASAAPPQLSKGEQVLQLRDKELFVNEEK